MSTPFTTAGENIPVWRLSDAVRRKTDRKLLFAIGGGIGDQICGEPAVRYALDTYKDCEITILTRTPDLVRHLAPKAKAILDYNTVKINREDYIVFQTYVPDENFTAQFYHSLIMSGVDYSSVALTRGQIPIEYRQPQIVPTMPPAEILNQLGAYGNRVLVHMGVSWPSRTFPLEWWAGVVRGLLLEGMTPVLIGREVKDGGVHGGDFGDKVCDLRNKTSLLETVWLLQNSRVVITNDSGPLHMAASLDPTFQTPSNPWICFFATARRADFTYHFRGPNPSDFGRRMEDLSLGGVWDLYDFAPNRTQTTFDVKNIAPEVVANWLPDPKLVARWAASRWGDQ